MSDRKGGKVGFGRPPKSTQFRKGQSGNPNGRPKGRRNGPPFDAVLSQMVTIRENGKDRRVTAAEAFLLQLAKEGLEGDARAASQTLEMIERAKNARGDGIVPQVINVRFGLAANSIDSLESLRIVRKLDRYRPTARVMLETWVIEAALARLGDRKLTEKEQHIVVSAARQPDKVAWPAWWTVKRGTPPGLVSRQNAELANSREL